MIGLGSDKNDVDIRQFYMISAQLSPLSTPLLLIWGHRMCVNFSICPPFFFPSSSSFSPSLSPSRFSFSHSPSPFLLLLFPFSLSPSLFLLFSFSFFLFFFSSPFLLLLFSFFFFPLIGLLIQIHLQFNFLIVHWQHN